MSPPDGDLPQSSKRLQEARALPTLAMPGFVYFIRWLCQGKVSPLLGLARCEHRDSAVAGQGAALHFDSGRMGMCEEQ